MIISELSKINAPQSPTTYGARSGKLDRITPHCIVGNIPASSVMSMFAKPDRKASSNYIIGKDGEIACSVPEDIAACTSGSSLNDKRAITIECASGLYNPYKFEPIVFESLVNLTVDIMKRYNKNKLVWIPDKKAALEYDTKDGEMLITIHRWFQNVECPGNWLIEHMDEYVEKVNKNFIQITPNVLYKVQVGAFSNKKNAERLRDELRNKGYKDCFIYETRI